ncbi:AAA family ATPase [Paracholeplasma manati]|uniref:AAA family ATPase n=1 Tax=Paracholeplasma manati TaxID=591373 RepID=UPI0024083A42|nr:AAA family ATPase [Paracholeplasma manati]MDG0889229.1 AAA family ATPase [Paracholeplasma manati]
MDNIVEALKHIEVSNTTYDEWLIIGMALKAEGYDVSVWDDWSKNDSRYKTGECERKWRSFNGSSNPTAGGTIIKIARDSGWEPRGGFLEWDDIIEYDGDGMIYDPKSDKKPTEQLITYLETLFKDDEFVGYVTNDVWKDSEGKWKPGKGQYDRTAKELIELLKKHPDDIGAVVGDWKGDCGAWIRFNPVDGTGVKNENITRFTYALVEFDTIPVSEQDAIYRKYELPIACLVHSAGKSLHAIVKVDASDYEEYRKRVEYLYGFLEKKGLKIDTANRNPSRLSRMPGVTRNGVIQTLVETNIGRLNWNEWVDFTEGVNDQLPSYEFLDVPLANPPAVPPELIKGIVRVGHKMLISGSSKAGKSFLLMELAVALSEGIKWLGFQCKKSKVLYINLEIDRPSFINRFIEIYKAMKLKPKHSHDIAIWNLRGEAMPLDKLVPILVRRIKNQGFDAVIIDPIYKVITGDENNASQMGAFSNQFDKICKEAGVSAIYSHHHSKGAQGFKKAMDRASGSGVFARDPDAQLDMIQLETTDEFMAQYADVQTATAWRLESSLREFSNFKPVNFWFEYPLHRVDDKGILAKHYADGDPKANLDKSGKRNQTTESRKDAFDAAFDICLSDKEFCTTDELANYLGISVRTVQKRVSEFESDYLLSKGNVYRK